MRYHAVGYDFARDKLRTYHLPRFDIVIAERSVFAFEKHAHRAVGALRALLDLRHGTYAVKVGGFRPFCRHVFLRDDKNVTVGVVRRLVRFFADIARQLEIYGYVRKRYRAPNGYARLNRLRHGLDESF